MQESKLDYPQPFFLHATNMNNTAYVVRKTDNELYGFNLDGYISKLLVDDVYNEGVPSRIDSSETLAIEWYGYTGWMKASNSEVELAHGYLHWAVEGRWNIGFMVNSFVLLLSERSLYENRTFPFFIESILLLDIATL